jgi:Nif-specific regulatory protein
MKLTDGKHAVENTRSTDLAVLAKELLAEFDIHSVLSHAMDRIISLSGAERGMIVIFDRNGENLFQSARNLQKENIDQPEFEASRTIINRVKSEGRPACIRNALEDSTLKKSNSILRLKILSVICLPLIFRNETFGVIYLDNRTVKGMFQQDTYVLVREFADMISLASYRSLEHTRMQTHLETLEGELRGKYRFESIVGSHPKIVEILKLISQIADTDATVLIQGESGTGKELVAKAIHFNSSRRDKPFIPINCAALPENLLESELFGHVRGAFTGAVRDKPGWFERADGGTLFLDEIGDMASSLQVKLLRVLQTGDYSRLGSTEIRHCNVRVIAAASKDLRKSISDGRFREELYYRLNVIDIVVPPLRDRKCDIPLLVAHFLKKYCAQLNKKMLRLSRDAEHLLLQYDFPGNIRELENAIQRAVVLTESGTIETSQLPPDISRQVTQKSAQEKPASFKAAKQKAVNAFEKDYLAECLRTSKGNISLAAKCAGMDVKNFHVKMKKCGIDPASFK